MNPFRFLTVAAILTSLTVVRSEVVTLSTGNATRPNAGEIRAFLGPIGAGGPLLAKLEGLTLSGTAVVDVHLSPEGNGTTQLLTTDLLVSDVAQTTIDLGVLGTTQLTATGLKLKIQTAPINVQNNQFTVTAGTGGGVTVNDGTLQISNSTGLIGSLLPGGYFYNFNSSPLSQSFFLIDPPIQGTIIHSSSQTVLTLGFPEFAFNNPLIANDSVIGYLQFAVSAQLASAVPEVEPSWMIGLLVLGGLLIRIGYCRITRKPAWVHGPAEPSLG